MLSVDRHIVIFQLKAEILAFCLQVEFGIVWHILQNKELGILQICLLEK